MPILRRKALSRREWNEQQRYCLESGYNFMNAFAEEDVASIADAWAELREEILEKFIAESPGRRPWGFWKFDATEPRRLISGPGAEIGELTFGVPHIISGRDFYEHSRYEAEATYLRRLNLLTPAEQALDADGCLNYRPYLHGALEVTQ